MGLNLSDKELDAMDGLPYLHRCLYIFGIRRYMDYATGITGIKRKISYKSLSEEIYVTPHQGLKDTRERSVAQLKRAIKALEKAGLITNHSIATKTEKQLILKCILATTDKSAQNKAVPNPYHSPVPEAVPVKNKENTVNIGILKDGEEKSRTETRTSQNEKAVPHPLSDTLHNITLPTAQDFFQLLAKQGYYVNQLHGNKKTLAMVHAWVEARITLQEAEIGINHANTQLGKLPDTPTYYNKPVLQVRKDFEKAQEIATEELNHETHRLRPVSDSKADSRRNRYKKILR
jgi:hypothetical protein